MAKVDYEAKIIHLQEELAVLSQQLSGGQAAQVKELVRLKEDNAELQQEVGVVVGVGCMYVCVWGGEASPTIACRALLCLPWLILCILAVVLPSMHHVPTPTKLPTCRRSLACWR